LKFEKSSLITAGYIYKNKSNRGCGNVDKYRKGPRGGWSGAWTVGITSGKLVDGIWITT
jgi:hypothetical protein